MKFVQLPPDHRGITDVINLDYVIRFKHGTDKEGVRRLEIRLVNQPPVWLDGPNADLFLEAMATLRNQG